MTVRTEFPRRIRRIDNSWIPLSDGTRLAARIWLPEDAEADPVPAILEYLPYRKGDAMAARDARHHPYFAGHGYAAVRVDLRGSGDSDGILLDEYLPQEQQDGLEVLEWLAAQPWCTGRVGLFGISWGGFNGLQIAALRPPQLGAVISMCASDDRYADDVHYVGGCVLATDMLPWAATMLTLCAMPPDPAVAGEGWRETWMARMQRTPAYLEAWLGHQRRDDYWRQGSVCEDPSAITAPVYAVGGWADGYSNAIPRLLATLPGPRKGLIGPWAHAFPQDGEPGPAIGFLQECLRWWDRWLKGVETGIMDEPMLRAWMQESVAPAGHHTQRPGRWVAERSWPSDTIGEAVWMLGADGLVPAGDTVAERAIEHRSPQTTGLDAGAWCADGGLGDWPVDQRAEDGRSLTFTSAPLDAPLELLGFPEVELALRADRPSALVAVRLCDVAPDGASLLVTRGTLNLTPSRRARRAAGARARRASERARPARCDRPGDPGRAPAARRRLERLLAVAVALARGRHAHRSRRAGQPPDAARPPAARRRRRPARLRPAGVLGGARGRDAAHRPDDAHDDARPRRRRARDHLRLGRRRQPAPHGVGHRDGRHERDDLPDRRRRPVVGVGALSLQHGPRARRLADARGTDSRMTATASEFLVTHTLDAYEGEERVLARTWTLSFPRDGV